MTAFLFLVVVVLAIWIARTASKGRRNERTIAQLTARVFNLEQELKNFVRVPPPAALPQPAPAVPVERLVPEPPPVQAPPPVPAPTVPAHVFVPPSIPAPRPRKLRGFSFRNLLNLEETLGTNWLNKLGIVILVIGVALFLGYEVRELGPIGKVTVGYAVSLVMLGAGIFFERRDQWRVLARGAIGGGWSLLYFTTYAMYHVPAAHVLSSEGLDLGLLLVVAAGMVVHTLRYNAQVVTGLAFLLAFTTVNLSRGNAFSLIASAILAAGLAFIALRRRWFEMEVAGMIAAYVNHYLWLRPVIEPMHGHVHMFPDYFASAALLYGYWLIFLASYVLRRVENRGGELVSTIAAVLNVGLLGWVMGYQSVHPELAFQFFVLIGIVEFVVGQLPITRRRRAAFVVLTTLGCCFLVAAFPFRYSGGTVSASWLAEAEALVLAGVFLREVVYRRLGLAAALVTFIQMVGKDAATVLGDRTYNINQAGRPGLALLFAIAAVAFYIDSQYIPRRWPEVITNYWDDLCFRRLAHLAGILAFIGMWIAWPGAWTAVAWAVLGILLVLIGRRWNLTELPTQAALCAAAAFLRVLFVNLEDKSIYSSFNSLSERLLTVVLVIAALYVTSRWVSGIGPVSARRISAGYTWGASLLTGLLAWYELEPVAVALAWSMAGLVLLEIGLKWRQPQLRFQAYAGFTASFLRLFFVNLNATGRTGEVSARVYTILPVAIAFYYVYARLTRATDDTSGNAPETVIAKIHCFFGTLALAALLRFELDPDLVAAAWAALGLLLAAAAWKTGRRILLDQGILLAFGVLLRGILHNLYERSYFPAPFGHGRFVSLGTTIVLLLVALPFAFSLRLPKAERRHRLWFIAAASALDHRPEQVFFFVPFALLTAMLAVEMPTGMVTLAWGVEAFGVFALALWLKERSYRLAALGLLLLCVLKIVLRDVWGLAPRDRYLTFIVLGSALLAVSYLYTRFRTVLRQYL
jgi:uncharacterized membrane protein